jgi:serine/threonine protein phosphatase PrpC
MRSISRLWGLFSIVFVLGSFAFIGAEGLSDEESGLYSKIAATLDLGTTDIHGLHRHIVAGRFFISYGQATDQQDWIDRGIQLCDDGAKWSHDWELKPAEQHQRIDEWVNRGRGNTDLRSNVRACLQHVKREREQAEEAIRRCDAVLQQAQCDGAACAAPVVAMGDPFMPCVVPDGFPAPSPHPMRGDYCGGLAVVATAAEGSFSGEIEMGCEERIGRAGQDRCVSISDLGAVPIDDSVRRNEAASGYQFHMVCDGHGYMMYRKEGRYLCRETAVGHVVDYVKENFHKALLQNENFPVDIKLALRQTCRTIDAGAKQFAIDLKSSLQGESFMYSDLKLEQGTTLVCAVVTPESRIFIATVGDSMVRSYKDGELVFTTVPHNISCEGEVARILGSGGTIACSCGVNTHSGCMKGCDRSLRVGGVSNVNTINGRSTGQLAMTRAFGDWQLVNRSGEKLVPADPDIHELRFLGTGNEVLVLASDGVWDTEVQSPWMGRKINEKLGMGVGSQDLCKSLVDEARLIWESDGSFETIDDIAAITLVPKVRA